MIFLLILLVLSVIVESSLSTFPFVLILIIFVGIFSSKKNALTLAFLGGLLLDFLSFNTLAWSSIVFLILAFLIIAYQHKFEANSSFFVFIFTLFGSFFYLLLTDAQHALFISVFASIISVFLLWVYNLKTAKIKKTSW